MVRACLSLAGLVMCYKPAVWHGFVVLPRLFARCLALEGLSHLEVVSVSWDPRPREPVEGILQATSVLELAAHRCAASLHDSCACCRLQLLLCRVHGECGRLACWCCSGAVGAGLAGSGLPCGEDACRQVQSVLLSELSRCSVCHIAPLVERCGTCMWLLSAWCWLVVSSSEVLPESFSIGSGGSEISPAEVHRLIALCSGEVSQNRCYCPGEGFSHDCSALVSVMLCYLKDRPLSLLVEVLPRSALRSFWATIVLPCSSKCAVWLGYVLVRFSQDGSWPYWWRFSPRIWDAEGFGVLSWRRPDRPLSHCLSLRWFRSHIVVSGVRPQLGQAAMLRVLCVMWRLCLDLAWWQRQELG
ncbi:hypothetical protein Taro_016303 [Colocasia esculenta]|uniref:Uncharacterized protein n=1 Tax=Colocasia esculenta TaxID=4460 RepID=A0A843USJ1_COLES|nr:hypothetical protein [Colocasia esculenta]